MSSFVHSHNDTGPTERAGAHERNDDNRCADYRLSVCKQTTLNAIIPVQERKCGVPFECHWRPKLVINKAALRRRKLVEIILLQSVVVFLLSPRPP